MSKPSEVIMNLKKLVIARRASRLSMSAAEKVPAPEQRPAAEEPAAVTDGAPTEAAPIEEAPAVAPTEEVPVASTESVAAEEPEEAPKKRKNYYRPKKKQA